MHPLLQPLPRVLDRVRVWRVGWPCHDLHVVLLEPSHSILRSMYFSVILLKESVAEHVVHLLVDVNEAVLEDSDIHQSID